MRVFVDLMIITIILCITAGVIVMANSMFTVPSVLTSNAVKRDSEFRQVCEKKHGFVVYDGRQKVCLMEKQ